MHCPCHCGPHRQEGEIADNFQHEPHPCIELLLISLYGSAVMLAQYSHEPHLYQVNEGSFSARISEK
jgi:hypothetical protein